MLSDRLYAREAAVPHHEIPLGWAAYYRVRRMQGALAGSIPGGPTSSGERLRDDAAKVGVREVCVPLGRSFRFSGADGRRHGLAQ